ncbi:MAG: helix-turn-helix domain-containing protein [Vulcanimicrobiaceae bacterium]
MAHKSTHRDPPVYLRMREVAEELSVTARQVRIWIARNELSGIRICGIYRVTRDSLDDMVRRHRIGRRA